MAITDEKDEKLDDAENGDAEGSSSEPSEALAKTSEGEAVEGEGTEVVDAAGAGSDDEDGDAASTLGSERYVHAAFFVAGILAAFIASKTLVLVWNSLAAWAPAVRAVPALVSYGEEQRDTVALVGDAAGKRGVLRRLRGVSGLDGTNGRGGCRRPVHPDG